MNRRTALASVALGCAALAGCAGVSPVVPDDRYCFRTHGPTGNKSICTPGPVPDEAADAQAKRFEPEPGKLTIFVVRRHWGDSLNVVRVGVAGEQMVPTVPASLVKMVVAPGGHRLVFDWAKGSGDLAIHGEAGQVLFVDLVGSLWIWNEWYRLELGEPSIRAQALKSRLVADVRLDARR